MKLFPVQEIGSLPKAPWQISYLRNGTVPDTDLQHLTKWSETLRFEGEAQIRSIVTKPKTEDSARRLREYTSLFGIKYLESAGLDIVYDGEANRIEMYEHAIRHSDGFQFYGHVRSFDNRYYRKAACVEKARFREAYHLDEFNYVRAHAKGRIKVPITGPYTLADWSFNEYYQKRLAPEQPDFRKLKYEAKRELVLDIGREIIRPNLEQLVKAGADYIQVDEPALTTKPNEVGFFTEAYNEATASIDCKLSVHICYSDYRALYPNIMELKNCSQLALEFANRGPETRPYDQLNLMREYDDQREIGLGVSDVHTDNIEDPTLIRDRINYATKVLGDPSRIYVNPDCGLRTRSWDVAYAKLCNIVKGAEMARELAH